MFYSQESSFFSHSESVIPKRIINNLPNMTFSGVFSSVCAIITRVLLFLSRPICFIIAKFFTGTWKKKKATLQKENDREEELRAMIGTLKEENELLRVKIYKVDVTLDADTAHPRLQVSEDGESVKDTGVIRKVPSKEKRFDSHTFLLAKEGYTSGMHYWEVDVGKKHNWNLGVAQENVARKETVALSPKNGFWVIGLADGQEYWAHSDPWIRLIVSGRPQKIGIFLDISSKKLSFISVHQKKVLYTFTSVSHHGQNVRLFPFFSTGSSATSSDTEPLRIA
ncbi:butyrophilin subfamily 1 member A1-like isoform X3 [Coturnix japonica]|uniref:butyrophilin subfamily 1 member A1-like isoform X3 n=1 Tax=Coturnix japonica TaxID=93934 RepID=UPI0007771F0A|nr:butyrophilin subfamily 1 member A1-like isoform X3 [Coturnix japonica]